MLIRLEHTDIMYPICKCLNSYITGECGKTAVTQRKRFVFSLHKLICHVIIFFI